MVTVSLIKELYFIASILGRPILLQLQVGAGTKPITLEVNEDFLFAWYNGEDIWKEKLSGPDSSFGIESCDNISRIISCIDAQDTSWRNKYKYIQE